MNSKLCCAKSPSGDYAETEGERPMGGESGDSFSRRLLDKKYGKGNYATKSQTEYSKIKKWVIGHFNKSIIVNFMQTVFNLEHVYEENGVDEIKFIGIFSSIIKAQAAIDFLFNKQGFNKYPKECFQIHEIRIDEFEWKDGFLSWGEALNK